jgi:hypothetical protein
MMNRKWKKEEGRRKKEEGAISQITRFESAMEQLKRRDVTV